jgi:hypothetical protein
MGVRSRTELAILSQLGPALMTVHGWSAPEVGVAFERAVDLARQLESFADLAPPLAGLWLFRTARGQFSRADEITNELFNVARTLDDPDIQLQAHHSAWPIRWFVGALTDAKQHIDAALNGGPEHKKKASGARLAFIANPPRVVLGQPLVDRAAVRLLVDWPGAAGQKTLVRAHAEVGAGRSSGPKGFGTSASTSHTRIKDAPAHLFSLDSFLNCPFARRQD